MAPPRKKIEGKLGAFALQKIKRWVEAKTPERAAKMGERLGRLIMRASSKHRVRAGQNLRLVFPHWTDAQIEQAVVDTFEHWGRVGTDFLRLDKAGIEEISRGMVVTGEEFLEEAVNAGKGALLITGHLGHFERMARYLALKGYPLTVVARDADDHGVNGILNGVRTSSGMEVMARGRAARGLLEGLRQNRLIGILPDQNSQEALIPFFGYPAGTVMGPGVLQERTGAPLIGMACYSVGPQQYEVVIEPISPEPPTAIKGESAMIAVNQWLERAILRHPEQWLWVHDRWRFARQQGKL